MARRSILRRSVLTGAGSAIVAANSWAQSAFGQSNTPIAYDLSDSAQSARLFAKVSGTTGTARVWLQYYGEIFSVIPNQVQSTILKLKGLVRSDWTNHGADRYSFRNFDQGLFCDPVSGEVIDTYNNPITGEVNEPLHYRSGVLEGEVAPVKADGTPFSPPWRITGDQVSVTQTASGSRDNWLSPEEWPLASTGATAHFNTSSTYIAELDEVNDMSVSAVPADHIWTFLTPFPAWMLLGQIEGFAMWRWIGRKIVDPSELDSDIVAEVERRAPGFMGEDDPWEGHLNGWVQYMMERKPIRKSD